MAFVILRWCRRRGWPTAGLYASFLYLCPPLVIEKGTRGEIEMLLAACVTLALFTLYESREIHAGARFGRNPAAYGLSGSGGAGQGSAGPDLLFRYVAGVPKTGGAGAGCAPAIIWPGSRLCCSWPWRGYSRSYTAVGLIGSVPARAYERLLPEQGLRGLAWGALWVGLCGVAFVAFSRGRLKATGVALLALLVTAKAIYVTAYIPRREQRKSPREIAARVVARLPENVCSPSE